ASVQIRRAKPQAAMVIVADASSKVCSKCVQERIGLGEKLIRIRPSFRLIEFSSQASDLAIKSSRSPLFFSTQTLAARSPLPMGIEPDASSLGESQTTLYFASRSSMCDQTVASEYNFCRGSAANHCDVFD